MKHTTYLLPALLALMLGGCATIENAPAPSNKLMSSTARNSKLDALHSWQANGAISITNNNKTDMGSFTWAQNGLAYDFSTFGPLNAGSIRIAGHPGKATLWKNVNTPISAGSPEAIMKKELGWFLPLSNLRFWSRGLPAPDVANKTHYDKFGHLEQPHQQGWRIDYHRYQSAGKGYDLPRNLIMTNGNMRVKVVIKQWQI